MFVLPTSPRVIQLLCFFLLASSVLSNCREKVFLNVSCSPTCSPLDCVGTECHSREEFSFPYAQIKICSDEGLSCPNPAKDLSYDVCASESVTRASLTLGDDRKGEFNVTFFPRFDLEVLLLIDTGSAPSLSRGVGRLAVFRAISRMKKLGRIAVAQFGSVADFGLRSLRVIRQLSFFNPPTDAFVISRGKIKPTNPSEVLRAMLLASTGALVRWRSRRRVIVLAFENSSKTDACEGFFTRDEVVQVLRQTGTSVVWLTNQENVNECISYVVRETNGEILPGTNVQKISSVVKEVSRRSVGGRSEIPGSVVRLQNTQYFVQPNVGPRRECDYNFRFNSSRGQRFLLQDPQVRESFQVQSTLGCRPGFDVVCDVSFTMFDNYIPLNEVGEVRRGFVEIAACP